MISLATAMLRNRRMAIWAAAASVAVQAATENRAFTADEEYEWYTAMSELEYMDARIRGALAAEQECASAGAG